MHTLSILVGPSGTSWALMFKTEDAAKAQFDILAAARVMNGQVTLKDEFGQQAHFKLEDFHGAILEDMDLTQQAVIARSIHQAQTQARAHAQAANDPVLKTAAMTQRGPAMLTPMGNGRFS